MKLERVERYARELGGILEQATAIRNQAETFGGYREVVNKLQDAQQEAQIVEQYKRLVAQLQAVEQLAMEKTNRSNYEGARTLYIDIGARLKVAHEQFAEWRSALAEFELLASMQMFSEDGPNARAEYEKALEFRKQKYLTAERLAGDLVPNKATVILT